MITSGERVVHLEQLDQLKTFDNPTQMGMNVDVHQELDSAFLREEIFFLGGKKTF